jgi:hypothetical protein
VRLHRDALDARTLEQTIGCILKTQEDWELLRAEKARYLPLLSNEPVTPREPAVESDYGIGSVSARRG